MGRTLWTVWLLLLPASAQATWSLVAVDPATRQVGIAVASCISGVEVTAGIAPGRGVVTAQAWSSFRGRDRAVELLRDGASPGDVIEAVANADFDRWSVPLYPLRQYGVAALGHEDAPSAFSGEQNPEWKGDLQGYGVSVQGNTLYGAVVVRDALAAFEAGAGRPLAERLLAGLEAGAAAGGDNRCSRAQAALSAMLLVALPDDDPAHPWLRLRVPDGARPGIVAILGEQIRQWRKRMREGFADAPLAPGESNPVHELRRRYEAWCQL